MNQILNDQRCIAYLATGAKNGKCFTNWSVMISRKFNARVGHQEEINSYVINTQPKGP